MKIITSKHCKEAFAQRNFNTNYIEEFVVAAWKCGENFFDINDNPTLMRYLRSKCNSYGHKKSVVKLYDGYVYVFVMKKNYSIAIAKTAYSLNASYALSNMKGDYYGIY